MLEGNEVEQKLGEYGQVVVDVNLKGDIKIAIEGHVNIFTELKKAAAKTNTPLDDSFLATLEKIAQGLEGK